MLVAEANQKFESKSQQEKLEPFGVKRCWQPKLTKNLKANHNGVESAEVEKQDVGSRS